jgi:methylated-DNA-[protein]-cysteine S-methyltransferase
MDHSLSKGTIMTSYSTVQSHLGAILLTADGGALTGLYFEGQRYAPRPTPEWVRRDDLPVFAQARAWLDEYFAGRRPAVDLPLAPKGTPFQRAVWRQIARIPSGETLTYAELAQRSGNASAVRAAGAATGRNPVSLLIPCHRVVGSDGSLTGYAGGLERKRRLLALEAAAGGTAQPPAAHRLGVSAGA